MEARLGLTLAQFRALPEKNAERHELDQGDLIVTPPPKHNHSALVSELVITIGQFVRQANLGRVYTSETGYILADDPLTIRVPDVSFVRRERMPAKRQEEYIHGAPDLAIEVVSASETAQQLKRKLEQYFQTGCQEAWVILPEDRETQVFRTATAFDVVPAAEPLATPLLPGFQLRLIDLLD